MSQIKWWIGILTVIIYFAIAVNFNLNGITENIIVFALIGINFLIHKYIDKKKESEKSGR